MAKYECNVCGWIYDEELGDPEHGIAAGTRWEDVPDDWQCPDCGVTKDNFTLIEAGPAPVAQAGQQGSQAAPPSA